MTETEKVIRDWFTNAGSKTSLPHTHCPNCKRTHILHTGQEGRQPGPLDFGICDHCGTFYRFDENMKPRTVTKQEWEEIPALERQHIEEVQRLFMHANAILDEREKGRS